MSSTEARTPPLQALLDAFNAHDLDAIMSFFTEDCVFDTPRGPAPGGQRMVGKQQVRQGFQARFDGIPDIVYGDDRHWSCGDRGVSEWTISGKTAEGVRIEVRAPRTKKKPPSPRGPSACCRPSRKRPSCTRCWPRPAWARASRWNS